MLITFKCIRIEMKLVFFNVVLTLCFWFLQNQMMLFLFANVYFIAHFLPCHSLSCCSSELVLEVCEIGKETYVIRWYWNIVNIRLNDFPKIMLDAKKNIFSCYLNLMINCYRTRRNHRKRTLHHNELKLHFKLM